MLIISNINKMYSFRNSFANEFLNRFDFYIILAYNKFAILLQQINKIKFCKKLIYKCFSKVNFYIFNKK